jgi:hypothetical protein
MTAAVSVISAQGRNHNISGKLPLPCIGNFANDRQLAMEWLWEILSQTERVRR